MTPLKACVIGQPIDHSLSPDLHGYWLRKYNIDGNYFAIEMNPDLLPQGLKELVGQGFQGGNLTLPHKELAVSLMSELSDSAKAIGAVNTVLVREDGSLYGSNTDAYGFIENIKASIDDITPYLEHCFILGAGGAAKAVHYALKEAGAKRISISNRSAERAKPFDADFIDWEAKSDALGDVTLLVNTTSLGMKGQPALEINLNALPKTALVSDIVYQPLYTDLLKQARERGHLIVTGIGMLIYQAVPGFESWFGIKPEVDKAVFDLLEGKIS